MASQGLHILTYTRRVTPSVTQGICLNDGHLRGAVKLTTAAKRLAVELTLPVLTT